MTDRHGFTRRTALGLIGAAAMLPYRPFAARAGQIDQLALFGPPAAPSVVLSHAVATDRFADIAATSTFTAWRTPDELRAGLTSGTILLSVVPVQAAANLHNRGFPIRLANVMTNGLLYILSDQPDVNTIGDLAGRKVAVPFRGDTPEIIFGQLLDHADLSEGDVEIVYTATPIEAMQLLLAGRVSAALTAEPAATAAILKGKQAGKTIHRAVSVQDAWGEMTGGAPVVPQAGLAVTGAFTESHGDTVPAILEILRETTGDVLADPQAAAKNASEALGQPAPLIAASVPHCNLVARPAGEARPDIERMLSAMDLDKIGGKLPDDAFYL